MVLRLFKRYRYQWRRQGRLRSSLCMGVMKHFCDLKTWPLSSFDVGSLIYFLSFNFQALIMQVSRRDYYINFISI